jgi:ribosome-binding factor A
MVISDAIANKLSDPRIEPFSSVTRVDVSGDLEHAKVWISVMGDANKERRTLRGLESAAGHVQRLVARELQIRTCPRITFHLDVSIKQAQKTIRIINESVAEDEARSEADRSQEAPQADAASEAARGDQT